MDLCLGESLLFGNDHCDGSNINTVFECIFITCLEGGNINCNCIVVIDRGKQIGGNRIGGFYHLRGIRVIVYILNSLRYTLTDNCGEGDFGAVIGAELFNIFLRCSTCRKNRIFFLFFSILNINTHDAHLNKRVNHIFI